MINYEESTDSLLPKGEWDCKSHSCVQGGTIIPYASYQFASIVASTAEPAIPLYLGFGNYAFGTQLFNINEIDLSGLNSYNKYEVFVMPRDGIVTSVAASIQIAGNGSSFNNQSHVNAQLYTSEGDSTIFNILTGAVAKVTPATSDNVVADTIISGITQNLSIPLKAGTRVLMVMYMQPDTVDGALVEAYFSAGVNII